ncbi:hypothetical protein Tco_1315190 [Tanacetum coccineum]
MKRGFRGAPRPLLPAMLLECYLSPIHQEYDAVAPSKPSSSTPPVPSTTSPQVQSPPPIPTPTPPPIPTPTPPPIPTTSPTPIPISTPTPTPIPDTEPTPFEHIYEEPSPVHQHFSPPQEQAPSQMSMDDLLQAVPKLISRIDSLETDLKQTKLTMGNAIRESLVKKERDSSVQGLVNTSYHKSKCFREEQVKTISPNTLEAAKTLSKVALFKAQVLLTRKEITRRRKEAKGKKVVSSLDFQEEVDTGAEQVNTAKGVNTGSIKLSKEKGKRPRSVEETPKKSKEQILQEEASLAEAIRLDSLQKEEEAKQIHLDSLLAQRIAEEEELNKQQKKRKAQVQFEAQHYTNEDWDLIKQRVKANAELSKILKRFGEELQTKTPKRMKDDEAKDDEPTKKSGKRRKQMARRGLHTNIDKDDSEGSDE